MAHPESSNHINDLITVYQSRPGTPRNRLVLEHLKIAYLMASSEELDMDNQIKQSTLDEKGKAKFVQSDSVQPKPSKGRIVHYKPEGQEPVCAIITAVEGDMVTLTLFGLTETKAGVTSLNMASSADEAEDRNWYWPPRV